MSTDDSTSGNKLRLGRVNVRPGQPIEIVEAARRGVPLKEVRQELRKVIWPTRQELVTYTIVVLVTVVVMTSYVFGLDVVFSRFVLDVFTS